MRQSSRPGLTRDVIIEAALRLLGGTGLDGLTVRRLAAELGVQSPALYWHFRSKQELLDGMADAIITDTGMSPPHDGESWQHWLARRARAYRRSLRAHRDGARIIASARTLGPATVKTFDQELAILVSRGFTPVLALRTIATLTRYINGFVLQEQTEPRQGATSPPGQLAALPGRGTPSSLLTAIRNGGSLISEQAFEHGVHVIIDGTAITLTHQHPSDTPPASRD